MKAEVHEYSVLWTKHLTQKRKQWNDGTLKFHVYNNRALLYDETGIVVTDAFVPQSRITDDIFKLGHHLIDIQEKLGVVTRDIELRPKSSRPSQVSQVSQNSPDILRRTDRRVPNGIPGLSQDRTPTRTGQGTASIINFQPGALSSHQTPISRPRSRPTTRPSAPRTPLVNASDGLNGTQNTPTPAVPVKRTPQWSGVKHRRIDTPDNTAGTVAGNQQRVQDRRGSVRSSKQETAPDRPQGRRVSRQEPALNRSQGRRGSRQEPALNRSQGRRDSNQLKQQTPVSDERNGQEPMEIAPHQMYQNSRLHDLELELDLESSDSDDAFVPPIRENSEHLANLDLDSSDSDIPAKNTAPKTNSVTSNLKNHDRNVLKLDDIKSVVQSSDSDSSLPPPPPQDPPQAQRAPSLHTLDLDLEISDSDSSPSAVFPHQTGPWSKEALDLFSWIPPPYR